MPAAAPRSRRPARSGRAFTHDSSISASGSESQTMPPPTQRWIRPSATANVRIVSARSRSPFGQIRPSAPIEAPRPTGSSAAIRSIAAIFGAPVIEPPGKVAASSSVSRTRRRGSVPSTVETRCVTPASAVRRHQLGPADRARLADAREVVALEVDDHHVLGGVLRRLDRSSPAGARALDRHRPDAAPARARKSSGEAGHDRPAVAGERLRDGAAQRRERCGEPGRVARERRREVLDEVDLVDVAGAIASRTASTAAAYRSSDQLRVPCADLEAWAHERLAARCRPDRDGGGGQARARLRRGRRRPRRSAEDRP